MNAVPGSAVLRVAAPRRHLVMLVAVYLVLAGLGFVTVAFAGDLQRAAPLARLLIGFATAMLWAGWFARLAMVRSLFDETLLPGVRHSVWRALAVAALWTVALPALSLVGLGEAPLQAISLLVLAAAGGLLLATLQLPVFLAFAFVPLLFDTSMVGVLGGALDRIGLQAGIDAALPLTAVLALLLAAWRWHALQRVVLDEQVPNWRRPFVLMRPNAAFDLGAADRPARFSAADGTSASAFVVRTRVDDAGPHAPVRAVGACIGGAMGRLRPRDVLLFGAIVVAVLVLCVLPPDGNGALVLRSGVIAGGISVIACSGWTLARRLDLVRHRSDGALAELALLPGLGGPTASHDVMLRAVLERLVRPMLLLAVALAGVVVWRTPTLPDAALAIALWIGVVSANALVCAVPLAGRTVRTPLLLVAMLPALALAVVSVLRLLLPSLGSLQPESLVIAWGVLAAVHAIAIARLMVGFRSQPHPFLTV